MIDGNGNARLTDFGLAKYAPDGALTSTPCGSPIYVSPETISSTPYSPQISDMWSIGVVLYAMVTGQLPWTSPNRQQLFEQIKAANFSMPPMVTPRCEDLVRRLIVANPANRLTAREALEHPWIKNCPPLPPQESAPQILSLRRLDAFFAQDTDEPDSPAILRKGCCSGSSLPATWAKALNAITLNHAAARPKPRTIVPMQMCPSMPLFAKLPGEPAGAEAAPAADIHALMQEFAIMQKKKTPRVVKPRVKKTSSL
jgi:serine/threonine protein kinase